MCWLSGLGMWEFCPGKGKTGLILHWLTLHGAKGVRMRRVEGGALGLQTLEATCCTGCYSESVLHVLWPCRPHRRIPMELTQTVKYGGNLVQARCLWDSCCVLLPCAAAFVPSLRAGTSTDDLGSKTLQDFVTKASPKAPSCAPPPALEPSVSLGTKRSSPVVREQLFWARADWDNKGKMYKARSGNILSSCHTLKCLAVCLSNERKT